MRMSRCKILASLLCCASLCGGCGSVVVIEDGDELPITEPAPPPDDADAPQPIADECGCASTEVCVDGACYPERRVFASLVQISETGLAAISAASWGGSSGGPPATQDGDCVISSGPGATYDGPALNLGSATLSIDGGPPLSFPPLMDGHATLDLGLGPALAFAGGQAITIAWSGGADVPASSVSFATVPPVAVSEVAPMIPGEPWTLTWTGPSPEATVDLDALDGGFVSCSSNGSSITVPGTVTALIDTSGFPYSQVDARLILRPPIVEDALDNGVVVSGIALRLITIDIPPP